MGRRDAVQFTLELAAEWRRLGARVTFEPGFETRGNGTSADYEGAVMHHTVGASSGTNPMPTKSVLKAGRTGLPGPLCNSTGPWCEEGDLWIHVMAAHPANHAGASGGRSMGPLPVTSLFNPRAWGHEIDYLGTRPMTKGQMKSALIVAAGLANVLGRSTEYVRAHAETSVTGKWDPGYAPGQTIDMATFRRQAANFTTGTPGEDWLDMASLAEVEAVVRKAISEEGAALSKKQGYAGAADVYPPRQLPGGGYNVGAQIQQIVHDMLVEVSIKQGYAGAANPDALVDKLAPLILARIGVDTGNSPSGSLTKQDIADALEEFRQSLVLVPGDAGA